MISAMITSLRGLLRVAGSIVLVLAQGCREPDAGAPSQTVAQHAQPARALPATQAIVEQSPEDVFRRFLIALLSSDEAAIRDTMLVHEGMEILWADGQNRVVPEEIKALPLRRAQVGEALRVPSANGPWTLNVTANDVNDGRVLLLMPRDPVPHAVIKIDGRWRVDGGEFIAARMAVRRELEKRKAATPDSGLHL